MEVQADVFLLSHNRLEYLAEALDSIRDQRDVKIRVIVSDNSTNEAVSDWLKQRECRDIEVRRRRPALPVMEHLNVILREAEAPYVMLFHDDDVLYSHALATLLEAAKGWPNAAAISGNANMIFGRKATDQTFQSIDEMRIVRGGGDLVRSYLLPNFVYAPFPSYLYKTEAVRKVSFDEREAGKYSDVTFLAKLSEVGPLVWLPIPIMGYRRHQSNDSGVKDLKAVHQLVEFASQRGWISPEDFEVRHFLHWSELDYLRSATPWSLENWKIASRTLSFFILHPQILLLHFWRKLRAKRFFA